MTAVLTVQNLEKSFGPRRILAAVSFAVHDGDRIALVGVNGAGKSTLLRMIADEVGPDELPESGLITKRRGLTIEYVAQEPRLDADATVIETLRAGLARAPRHADDHEAAADDQAYEIRGLSAALAVPPADARIGTLSMGERRRVAIARALLARPELLALDEPTNHLDAATTSWLEGRLRERVGSLLLVTHDRYFLDRVATRIVELDRGLIYQHDAGYLRFLERQVDRWSAESTVVAKRAAFLRREVEWIRRGPAARTTKAKARIDRYDAEVTADESAVSRTGAASLRLPTGPRLGSTILELRDLGKRAPGGKLLFEHLELLWKAGDRIGVIGPNGVGKTTLVRTILGELAPDAGRVVVGQNTKFAFMDQARAALDGTKTVLAEVAGDSESIELEDGPIHVRTFLRQLLFDDAFADAKVGVLSGGERNRVQLAKLLREGGNFLILDEPTNDLDLLTLGVLEEALANFPGCALLVSHDRWFLDKVATGILAFEGEGKVEFFEGNCSDYLARGRTFAKAGAKGAPAIVAKAVASAPAAAPVRPRKLTFKEKQELSQIETAIHDAERAVHDLEATLQDGSIYATRAAEVPGLVASLERARDKVDTLYARWQELEAIAAQASG